MNKEKLSEEMKIDMSRFQDPVTPGTIQTGIMTKGSFRGRAYEASPEASANGIGKSRKGI